MKNKALRPKAPRARNQRKQETKGTRRSPEKKEKTKEKGEGGGRGGETRGEPTEDEERGNPSPEGAEQSRKTERPEEEVRRTRTRPGGRRARPGQEGRAHAHPHGTRAWRPPTRKGRCKRPHKTATVHRPSPLSNDGGYEKPEASVTGSTHANHRSASNPRPTAVGPARDNPIAGRRAGTTQSESSAPASAGASNRHNEPGSRPASARPAQPPSKSGGKSPRDEESHQSVRKADQSTESDRTGRGAAHHARPRGTPERRAAGHNHGTWTGARQQQPPDAGSPDSPRHNHTTVAEDRHQRGGEAKQRQRLQTPRTGSSGADQAAGTAAPRTAASRDQWRWTPRTGSSGAEQAGAATGS